MASNLLKRAFLRSVEVVQPSNLIRNRVQISKHGSISVQNVDEKEFITELISKPLYLIGFGKAAGEMGDEFLRKVAKHNHESSAHRIQIEQGIFSIPFGCEMKEISNFRNVQSYNGAHNNLPDKHSIGTTMKILEMIDRIPESSQKPLVLCFISGGGSALLSAPISGISLEEKLSVIQTMVKAGAKITELNPVRSALSEVKQGRLGERLHFRNCDVVSLILSDIVGDPLPQIASGPTYIPDFSPNIVGSILHDLKVHNHIPARIKNLMLDRSKQNLKFHDSNLLENFIIGNNKLSHEEAKSLFQEQCQIVDLSFQIQSKVPEFVKFLIQEITKIQNINSFDKDCLLIGSGETTLELSGTSIGLGGRCQHIGILLILEHLKQNILKPGFEIDVLFAGTDGRDGPTPVAGVCYTISGSGIRTQTTEPFIPELSIVQEYSASFNSYEFFRNYLQDSLVNTGPTGTNVMDLYMALIRKV